MCTLGASSRGKQVNEFIEAQPANAPRIGTADIESVYMKENNTKCAIMKLISSKRSVSTVCSFPYAA